MSTQRLNTEPACFLAAAARDHLSASSFLCCCCSALDPLWAVLFLDRFSDKHLNGDTAEWLVELALEEAPLSSRTGSWLSWRGLSWSSRRTGTASAMVSGCCTETNGVACAGNKGVGYKDHNHLTSNEMNCETSKALHGEPQSRTEWSRSEETWCCATGSWNLLNCAGKWKWEGGGWTAKGSPEVC